MNIPLELEKVNRVSPPVWKRSQTHFIGNDKVLLYFRDQALQNYEAPKKKEKFLDVDEDINFPSRFSLSYSVGGRLVELKRLLGHKPKGLGKSEGDTITDYSRGSRNRFIKVLMSIDYEKAGTPLFWTATYPGEYSPDPKVWKNDLHKFSKRLKREFPGMYGTWRLEPQKRGAPHFYGFLWGCPGLETMEGKRWFSKAWFEVVASGDERHLRAGTGIEVALDIKSSIFYMAKYQTKTEKGGYKQSFDYEVGRYWGVWNRAKLQIIKEEFELDQKLFFKVKRVLRKRLEHCLTKNKYREVIKGKQSGLWLSMSNEDILRLVDYIVRDEEKIEKNNVIQKGAGYGKKQCGKYSNVDEVRRVAYN